MSRIRAPGRPATRCLKVRKRLRGVDRAKEAKSLLIRKDPVLWGGLKFIGCSSANDHHAAILWTSHASSHGDAIGRSCQLIRI